MNEIKESDGNVAPTPASVPDADPEDRPDYSIVIPVFNSAALLPRLVEELNVELADRRFEVVFVNDGSSDDSWAVLQDLVSRHGHLTAIDLVRNYGQHSAMFCGFQHARGSYVITMDDDLQNPPSQVPLLIDRIEDGFDVVFGRFRRKQHGLVRLAGSKVVGWLNRRLFRKPPGLVLSNFRIVRREIVDAVCETRTAFPYIPGMLLLAGRSFGNVDVEHHARQDGSSGYGMTAIAALVWRIIFNYSALPLRWACVVGVGVSVLSFLTGLFFLVKALLVGTVSPGFPTLVCLLAFCNGVTLLVLGMMSEYIVRVVNEVSGIPAFRIRSAVRGRGHD